VFSATFTQAGGAIVEALKVPLANPDFAPFLQRARDGNPNTLFIFVPASQAAVLAKQFVERGLDKTGIKLIGPGDIADDEDLPGMTDDDRYCHGRLLFRVSPLGDEQGIRSGLPEGQRQRATELH
jgi:ABC-type branched-subunit amino acid transport system substrate-binding protein